MAEESDEVLIPRQDAVRVFLNQNGGISIEQLRPDVGHDDLVDLSPDAAMRVASRIKTLLEEL